MTEAIKQELLAHLQTAVEIELSTIPIYLYTYYSINRTPDVDACANGQQLATFANKAGGLVMSVAVEEMLHMSLACNILRALGGMPEVYLKSPTVYPTNLPHHKAGFSVGLEKLSAEQLSKFLLIEKPENVDSPPEGDNWETIGQFYEYIRKLIVENTTDADFQNGAYQLGANRGYYAPNNVDTVYPKDGWYLKQPENPNNPVERGASQAVYPNNEDSGDLRTINSKEAALKAIATIMHQGEGYPQDASHKADDSEKDEDSHWYKFNEIYQEIQTISADDQARIIYQFENNPLKKNYPSNLAPLVDATNAVYSYLFLMTQVSYGLSGSAQSSMFYTGMHKGMIFILDKMIGEMRSQSLSTGGQVLSPTFENYAFKSITSAKAELIALAEVAVEQNGLSETIYNRILDLPDVNVGPDGRVHF